MKKITLLFLLATTFAFAQETTTTEIFTETQPEEPKFEWYFGFGAILQPDYNINSNLLDAGVKSLPDVTPAFVVGWDVTFTNRLAFSMEFGSSSLFNNRKKDGSQLIQVPISARLQYIIANGGKLKFSAGANISYVTSSLSVFSDDTEIDMDDINPNTNTGYLLFRNNSLFAGPTASLKFVNNGKTYFTLTAGYDFSITNSKWKSDYARITNPVKENGGRAFLYMTIPFLK
jgi:hypothetical protein